MNRRTRRHITWITAVVLVGLLLLWNYWPSENRSIVSPTTTHFTSPLHPDGTVDYVGRINMEMSEGVTPETNAAIDVLKLLGVGAVYGNKPTSPERYVSVNIVADMLGVDPSELDGPYATLVPYEVYVERMIPYASSISSTPWVLPARDLVDALGQKRWLEEEHPNVASYLSEHEAILDGFVIAAEKPDFYMPVISTGELEGRLLGCRGLRLGQFMNIARALRMRAMLRLKSGNLDGAWSDIRAMRRMGRHLRTEPFMLSTLVALGIDGMAHAPFQALIDDPRVSPELLERIHSDLQSLPPKTTLVKAGNYERLVQIDVVQLLSADPVAGEAMLAGTMMLDAEVSSQNIDFTLLAQLLLERSQGAVDALDESDWPAMLHATESYDAWREHEYSAHPTQDTWELYGGRATREQATRTLADILTWLCSPSLGKTGREWGAVRVQSDLAEIAVAAKRYQFATGEYPESLDALVPDYVDAIPEDFLTAGAYVYKRSDTGCVIYSKGADGIDTGGVGDRNPDATNAMLLGISIEALSEMSREDYSEKDRDDVAIVLGTFTNEPAGTKGEE